MGLNFHLRHQGRFLALLIVTAALAGLVAATASQVAAAGQPPCPSCPDRYPPPGPPGGSGPGAGPSPAAQPAQPLISLGPITVQDGVASVTGIVNAAVGVTAGVTANVHVTVNARPVGIAVDGRFTAAVNLNAQAAIVVRAGDRSNGQTYSITIPASAIPSGDTPSDALAQLNADAVTLMLPADGFTIVDGVGIRVAVHVLGIAGIASLKLNGADLLAQLRIGSTSRSSGKGKPTNPPAKPGGSSPPAGGKQPACRHTASRNVSGSANNVQLTITGTNGASQTSTLPVRRVRSVIRVGRQLSVSAFGAHGIRITAIRFDTSAVARTHRLGITVTVRDRRHYLVRDAVVMLQPVAHRASITGSLARMSGTSGRATFTVPITTALLGHRLSLAVLARTPRATAHVTASILLAGTAR